MSSSKKQNTTADSKTSWYKTADTTRNVLEFLASTSDLLSCDRVCKLWKEQSMPLPKVVIRPSHTAHVAWLRNNLKRVKELDLVAVESSTDYCLWPSEVASQLYKALQAHTISFGSLQLRTFPESSLGGLSNLLQLKLDRCLQLVELPYGQLSKLTSLQSLVLEHCHGLSTITGDLSSMASLTKFTVESCNQLATIAGEGFASLRKLQNLTIINTPKLASLPATIGSIAWVTSLRLGDVGDRQLMQLPGTMGQLTQLKRLSLGYEYVDHLPTSFGNLSSLTLLRLTCKGLRSFPDSLSQLTRLQHLAVLDADHLEAVPETISNLQSLASFSLQIGFYNRTFRRLPNAIGQLGALQHLQLTAAVNVTDMPDTLDGLSQLVRLHIEKCGLVALPCSVSALTSLTHLSIDLCMNLVAIPVGLSALSRLKNICIKRCGALKTLPDIGGLHAVRRLAIGKCRDLQGLPESLCQLPMLQHLEIDDCYMLSQLPEDLGRLASLTKLEIKNCLKLKALPCSLSQLEHLKPSITNCPMLLQPSSGLLGSTPPKIFIW